MTKRDKCDLEKDTHRYCLILIMQKRERKVGYITGYKDSNK